MALKVPGRGADHLLSGPERVSVRPPMWELVVMGRFRLGHVGSDRRGPLEWSVRRHLGAIVVVVVVVFVLVGALLGRDTWNDARREVRADSRSVALVAADALSANVEVIGVQLEATGANPAVAEILATPSDCPIQFDLDLFAGAHMDFVATDGALACSSADSSGASHASAPWVPDLAEVDGMFSSEPFLDDVTGKRAVAFVVPVDGPAGARLGGVVIVAPTVGVADRLAEVFGDRNEFTYALTDGPSANVLSVGDGLNAVDDPMGDAGYITASRPVAGTSWELHAGIDPAVALAPTRSVLVRGALLGVAVLAVLLASLAVVNRRIVAPLRRLTALAGDAGPGVADQLAQVRGPREIVRLASRHAEAVEARERYEAQLAHKELHDPLTGLPNRALVAERLNHSLEHGSRSQGHVAVVFIDLDRFKLVNESLGHTVGDDVLIAMTQRLRQLVRAGDTLGRFGGDEFVIVRDGAHGSEDLAAQVLACVAEPFHLSDTVVRLTASVGVASAASNHSATDLIRDAHAAMYLAKDEGRGRWKVFEARMHDRAAARLSLETELRFALERDQLRVVYQPKVDLHTGNVIGAEALLRWDHPALGAVAPDVFVPVAEEIGIMVPIGRFVLGEACRQAVSWERDGNAIPVSVNVSGRQFDDHDLAAEVQEVLTETGLPATHLCLEITETLLMSDTVRSTQIMRDIHTMGVQLSIDDFGTGYSSLAYLHRFAFDELKIDRAFIDGIIEIPGQRSLVEATIAMAKALGLAVVAEGVETEAQAELLRTLGCDIAQGYLYAPPQAPASLQLPNYAQRT